MTLQEFLNANVVAGSEKEIILSDRFKDDEGNPLKFKIKAMSQSRFNELRTRAAKVNGGFDEGLFGELCIIENTVVPNFKDNASISQTGCANARQYLDKVLTAGEAQRLAREILSFSGFGKGLKELADEVKN